MGYKLFRKDRNTAGGGVLVAVKSKYEPESVQFSEQSSAELAWAKVTLKNQRTLLLGAFYCPPIPQIRHLEELDRDLAEVNRTVANNPNTVVIIGGDFNTSSRI